METQKGWGVVFVAGIFAVVVIGTAIGTYFFNGGFEGGRLVATESSDPNDEDGDGLATWEELVWHTDQKNPDTDGDGVSDGDEVRARTDPTVPGAGTDTYSEWGGSTPTEQFALNYAIAEEALTAVNASDEETQATIDAIVASMRKPDIQENIPLEALTIGTSTPLLSYRQILLAVLEHSAKIREYELTTFEKTVSAQNYSGTPALKEAATTYKQIEAALIVMEIPQQVAIEHLAVVNAIGSLGNIVNAMAVWSGDPIAGLAYADTFLATEHAVEATVTALVVKIASLLKTTS